MIQPETSESIGEFLMANDDQQRHLFDEPNVSNTFFINILIQNKKKAQATIRAFFDILNNVKSDNELIGYSLAHLDGILEDSRARVHHYIAIQNDFKKPENLIEILNSFLYRNNIQDNLQRDMASHILALLIEAEKFEKCHK